MWSQQQKGRRRRDTEYKETIIFGLWHCSCRKWCCPSKGMRGDDECRMRQDGRKGGGARKIW
jgi:hypothetical protein